MVTLWSAIILPPEILSYTYKYDQLEASNCPRYLWKSELCMWPVQGVLPVYRKASADTMRHSDGEWYGDGFIFLFFCFLCRMRINWKSSAFGIQCVDVAGNSEIFAHFLVYLLFILKKRRVSRFISDDNTSQSYKKAPLSILSVLFSPESMTCSVIGRR